MIRTVFMDAALLVSLIHPRDQNHQKAKDVLSAALARALFFTIPAMTQTLQNCVGVLEWQGFEDLK